MIKNSLKQMSIIIVLILAFSIIGNTKAKEYCALVYQCVAKEKLKSCGINVAYAFQQPHPKDSKEICCCIWEFKKPEPVVEKSEADKKILI